MKVLCAAAIALVVALGAIERISLADAAESTALVEGARKEGQLTIYSLLAVPDHSRIVSRFREKYPFIEVSLTRPGASERITARVLTEARAGRPLVDVVVLGIAANAPHPDAAKLYLNYVLSKEVQEGLLEEQFVKPSGRTDVKSAFMAKIRSAKVQMIAVDESLGERWEHYEKLFQSTFKLQ